MIPVPKGTLRLADYDFPFRVEFGTSVPDASELEEFASLKTLAMGRLKKDRDLVVSSCRVSDCGAAAFSIRIDKALVLPPRYYWIKNKLACVELFDSGEGETADSLYDVLTRRFGEPAPSEVPGSRGPSNKFKMVWRRDGLRVFYPLDASGDDRKALICNRAGAERLHKDVLQGARL